MASAIKSKAFLLTCALALLFSVTTGHADAYRYTDTCNTLQPAVGVEYHGFSLAETDLRARYNWAAIPDVDGLRVGSSRQATAYYQISGATAVEVGYYTPAGAFATLSTDGIPGLGVHNGSGERYPIYCKWPSQGLFCTIGSTYWEQLSFNQELLFQQASKLPSGLIPYGLQVSVSTDGAHFTQLTGVRQRDKEKENYYSFGAVRYYEVMQYSIPKGVKAVRVTMNDMVSFPTSEGGTINNRLDAFCLAQVDFTGNSIVLGPAESSSSTPSLPGGITSSSSLPSPDLNSRPPSSSHPPKESSVPSSSSSGSSSSSSSKPSSNTSSSDRNQVVPGDAPRSSSPSGVANSSGETTVIGGGSSTSSGPSPLFYVAGGAGLSCSICLGAWLLLKGR